MRKVALFLLTCLLSAAVVTGCGEKQEEAAVTEVNSVGEVAEKSNTIQDAEVTDNEAAKDDMIEAEATNNETAAGDKAEADGTEETGYQDGTYQHQTKPDAEGYYTKGSITIESGRITEILWTIYDSGGRVFDETYEQVFVGNELYMQQSREDWSGSRGYSDVLLEEQNVEEVDAISGATWTNRKFKEFVLETLTQAIQ